MAAVGLISYNTYPLIGTIAFDSSDNKSNVYRQSTIKKYVDAYGKRLNEINGQLSDIRLITSDELSKLGCTIRPPMTDGGDYGCKKSYSWLNSTSYWTSSAYYSNYYSDRVWVNEVLGSDSFNGDIVIADNKYGVRPVITISKSLFE